DDLQDNNQQDKNLQGNDQQLDKNQQTVNTRAGPSYSNIENAEISNNEVSDEDSYEEEKEEEETNNKTPDKIDSSEEKISIDSLYELFQRVFINDSWNYPSPIEKLYYLARIFPLALPKKHFRWVHGTNKKEKQCQTNK
ncbi:19817_t:CDS:2, partial [Racocetra persica]